MTNRILIILLLFPLAVLNSCNSNNDKIEQPAPTRVEEYQNNEFYYSVNVKSDWKKEVMEGDGFSNVIWKLPPLRSKYSKNLIAVHVSVEATKNWDSFEEALSSSLEEIKTTAYYYKWDEKSNSVVSQYGDPKRQLKGKCYYLFEKNIVYRLTFSANKDTYDQYISEFEHFCKTFKTIH